MTDECLILNYATQQSKNPYLTLIITQKGQMAFIEMLIGITVAAPFAMSRWNWFRKILSNND
jgi:hypothetical protein